MSRATSRSGIKCRVSYSLGQKAEAVAQAFSRALEDYPESQGYSNHQAAALEVTVEFLNLARTLPQPSPDDQRRGEHAIMGEAAESEDEIMTDTDTPM